MWGFVSAVSAIVSRSEAASEQTIPERPGKHSLILDRGLPSIHDREAPEPKGERRFSHKHAGESHESNREPSGRVEWHR